MVPNEIEELVRYKKSLPKFSKTDIEDFDVLQYRTGDSFAKVEITEFSNFIISVICTICDSLLFSITCINNVK